jgi:predicted RNase H-like HicB family nuclease
MPQMRNFEVVLDSAEGGGYVVSAPELPGLWTQGETRVEAIANAREAIALYLDTTDDLVVTLRPT